ncbi:arginine succinyltransferase [Citrobacter koseri]|uniref:Arginine succinyltransferase n=1 Tax=Citrobacter koseri TaxID=545 RepID=A0A447UVD3_CITKO|nr:arginine succinyltransferase [Citrobacter koseri]
MMVIRPVERRDVSALMQLASKTGGGLTSLPADEATLTSRIERALKTWRGELPKKRTGLRVRAGGQRYGKRCGNLCD